MKKKKMERCGKCGSEWLVSIKYPELMPCLNCAKNSEKPIDKVKKVVKGKRK